MKLTDLYEGNASALRVLAANGARIRPPGCLRSCFSPAFCLACSGNRCMLRAVLPCVVCCWPAPLRVLHLPP